MGKGDQEESNAARRRYVNPGDKQLHERRGFQGLLLSAPACGEDEQQRKEKLDSFCSLARENFI